MCVRCQGLFINYQMCKFTNKIKSKCLIFMVAKDYLPNPFCLQKSMISGKNAENSLW